MSPLWRVNTTHPYRFLREERFAHARLDLTSTPHPRGDIILMANEPQKDPFVAGEEAARENIPAEANPYQEGSEDFALWSAGHERVASAMEAQESEGT